MGGPDYARLADAMRNLSCAVLCFATVVGAQNLRVTGGAVDDQVFQRDATGNATVRLEGAADGAASKAVEARVIRKHMPVTGWTQAGMVTSAGHWSGDVRNIPAGGPYKIELRIPGTAAATAVNDVLVGDLWVLAGQSNMEGVGDLVDTEMPHEKLAHNFDLADQWLVAEEPLHTLPGATDRVHWRANVTGSRSGWKTRRYAILSARARKARAWDFPSRLRWCAAPACRSGCFPVRMAALRWTSGIRNCAIKAAIRSTDPCTGVFGPLADV